MNDLVESSAKVKDDTDTEILTATVSLQRLF
jgi:hypothetical protein